MKKLKLIFWISVIIISFYSCSKHDSTNSEMLTMETLNGKWIVSQDSSIFNSFEFNNSGYYIILIKIGKDSTALQGETYGAYQIIDNQTVKLANVGTLKLLSINNNNINFIMTLQQDPSIKITISATKAAQIPKSIRTDLLCRTWQLDSLNGKAVAGTLDELTALFSYSGTYLVQWTNPADSISNYAAQWKWKDSAESTICYSLDGEPTCIGDNEVQILSLTINSLKINDTGDIEVLTPMTLTKSAIIGSIKTKAYLKIKKGLLKK